MKQFSMGNAFSETKAFVMQSPLLYVGLILLAQILAMVIVFLPIGGMAGFQSIAMAGSDPLAISQMMAGFGGLFIICMIAGAAITLAGNFAVWRHGLSNGSISAGEALIYGLKACFPALLFFVVGYFAIILCAIFIGAIFGGIGSVIGNSTFFGIVSVVFGIAALAGFIYLLARLSIMGPLMADQNKLNPFTAAGQSWRATNGNGWMIALFFVLCYIVFAVVYFVAAMLAGAIGGLSGSVALTFILMMALILPILIIGILLGVGLPAGVYRDLVGSVNKAEIFN